MLKTSKLKSFLIASTFVAYAFNAEAMHHEAGGQGPSPKDLIMALEKCGADQMTLKKAKNLMKQMPEMPPHAGMPPAGMPPAGKPPAGKPPEFMANFMGSLSNEVMKCMGKQK